MSHKIFPGHIDKYSFPDQVMKANWPIIDFVKLLQKPCLSKLIQAIKIYA
jgi:hypothetical protein